MSDKSPWPTMVQINLVTYKILACGMKEAANLVWWLDLDRYFVAPSHTELIHFGLSRRRGTTPYLNSKNELQPNTVLLDRNNLSSLQYLLTLLLS